MEIDNETRQEVVDLLLDGRKIAAIKAYRAASGEGLKEAKEFCDALADRLREEHPDRMPAKGQGCGAAVLVVLVVVFCCAGAWL